MATEVAKSGLHIHRGTCQENDFEVAVESISHQFRRLIKGLSAERQALAAGRAALEAERRVVDQRNADLQEQVKLDIGGTIFHTTRSTLLKEPGSMLEAMFSGIFPLHPDADGSFFIDRDPKHFPFILNYLRDGRFTLPKNPTDRAAVLREARYYSLDGLMRRVTTQRLRTGLVAHWLFDEGAGVTACDLSGNGAHAIIDDPRWCYGPNGRQAALHLAPYRSLVSLPHIADVFPLNNDPYAISVWARHPHNIRDSVVLLWGEDFRYELTGMEFSFDGCCHVWGGSSRNQFFRGFKPGWHHYVMQYDGERREIWRDGVCVNHDIPNARHAVRHSRNLRIGEYPTQNVRICDLRVYNRALGEDEIAALFGMYTVVDPAGGDDDDGRDDDDA